jgi:hypothetical protein
MLIDLFVGKYRGDRTSKVSMTAYLGRSLNQLELVKAQKVLIELSGAVWESQELVQRTQVDRRAGKGGSRNCLCAVLCRAGRCCAIGKLMTNFVKTLLSLRI